VAEFFQNPFYEGLAAAIYSKLRYGGMSEVEAKKTAIQQVLDDQCKPSQQTNEIFAEANRLPTAWVTTGYYTWEEMSQLTAAAIAVSRTGSDLAAEQLLVHPTDRLKNTLHNDYFAVLSRVNDFQATWQKARTEDAIIDSPGFKRWVIDLVNAGGRLMREIDIARCLTTWTDRAAAAIFKLIDAFASALAAFVDLVYTVGKAIVDAGRKVIKMIGWWWPALKWGAIGLGGLVVAVFTYNKLVGVAERGRGSFNFSFSKLFPRRKALPAGQVSGRRGRR
jgi:hypothetical protein